MARIAPGYPGPGWARMPMMARALALGDLRGQHVVSYFYPNDNTPGCALQARRLRGGAPAVARATAWVVGVSPESGPSQVGCRDTHRSPFTSRSDHDHAAARPYGVWVPRAM